MSLPKLLDHNHENTDVVKRCENMQQLKQLTDSAIVVPTMSSSAKTTVISKVVPFSGASAQAGNKGSTYFKYVSSR